MSESTSGMKLDLSSFASDKDSINLNKTIETQLDANTEVTDSSDETFSDEIDVDIQTEGDESSVLSNSESEKPLEKPEESELKVTNNEDSIPHPDTLDEASSKDSIGTSNTPENPNISASEDKTYKKPKKPKPSKKQEPVDSFEDEYQALMNSLRSNVISNDPEEYENLKKIIEQIGELGKNSFELESAMKQTEEFRQKMLTNEFRNGLGYGEEPTGYYVPKQSQGVSRITLVDPILQDYINLGNQLEQLGLTLVKGIHRGNERNYKERLGYCNKLIRSMTEKNLIPSRAVRTKHQKRAWIQILRDDGSKISKLDIEQFFLSIDNILLKHKDIIEAQRKHKEDPRANPAPFLKPLLKDVHQVMNGLDIRVNETLDHMNEKQQKTLEKFMVQLEGYYEDQINFGLSGGRSFTPIKQTLGKIQNELNKSQNFGSVVELSNELEWGVERVNVLHWVMDELAKEVYWKKKYSFEYDNGKKKKNPTPGEMLSSIRFFNKNHKKLVAALDKLKKARELRNEIAHNGLIYDPDLMKDTCDCYERSISMISAEFGIDLYKFRPRKVDRRYVEEEIRDIIQENIDKPKYAGDIIKFKEDEIKHLITWGFGRFRKDGKTEASYDSAMKSLLKKHKPDEAIRDELKQQFSVYKEIEGFLIQASQIKNDRGQSLNFSDQELAKLVKDTSLRDLFSIQYKANTPEEKLRKAQSKLASLMKDYFAKQFGRTYEEVSKIHAQAQIKLGVEESQAHKKLYRAAILYPKMILRQTANDQKFLEEIIKLIKTELN